MPLKVRGLIIIALCVSTMIQILTHVKFFNITEYQSFPVRIMTIYLHFLPLAVL